MYAIVEIAGQQYKVEKDQQIFVHRLEGEEGSKVSFGNVLLTADGSKIEVGAPAVKGISVSGKILEHLKGDKVIVFKKKRRKGYKKSNGHRQYLTKVEITGFGKPSTSSAKKEDTTKKAEAPKATKEPAKGVYAPKASTKAVDKEPAKAAAPKATKSKSVEADDLTKISGIGPVFAKQLVDAGYTSYEHIAKITKEDIAKIDDIDGVNANKIESEDWKGQATVLNNFKKLLVNLGTAKKADNQDLTKINGIGEATEADLNEIGIYTYEQISKVLVKDMEYLSGISGVTRNTIETEEWVKQAKELMKK